MHQVFDPDNLFWRHISRGVDLVGLGLFWLVLCIPIVTVVPATSALYYTAVKVFRQKDTTGFRTLWRAFRQELKRGITATLICLPFAAVFVLFYLVLDGHKNDGGVGALMFAAYWIALLVPAGILCWLVPVMARFENSLKDAFATAFRLALRHLPSTFVVVLLNLQLTVWCMEKWWPVLFVPVLCSLLCSLFHERVFAKYLNEEDKALLEGRESEEE